MQELEYSWLHSWQLHVVSIINIIYIITNVHSYNHGTELFVHFMNYNLKTTDVAVISCYLHVVYISINNRCVNDE